MCAFCSAEKQTIVVNGELTPTIEVMRGQVLEVCCPATVPATPALPPLTATRWA